MRIQMQRFGCLHDTVLYGMWVWCFSGEHAVIRLYARTKAKEETLC